MAPYGAGRAILTLSASLQERLTRTLAQYAVPWGVTVLHRAGHRPGAGHGRALPRRAGATGLALKALAPAASVFKLVTAAALLEQGVSPGEEVCFHGGHHRLDPRLLADDPRRDRRCTTLETAFGKSANVVFAKLADRGLDASALRSDRRPVPVQHAHPLPARASSPPPLASRTTPSSSPTPRPGSVRSGSRRMHAALLAAIVANGGVFVPPVLVDEVQGAPAPARRRALARGGRGGGLGARRR